MMKDLTLFLRQKHQAYINSALYHNAVFVMVLLFLFERHVPRS